MKIIRATVAGMLCFVATGGSTRANIIFNLLPELGTSQQAIDGFTAAANLWSTALADNITINIGIGFRTLGPNIIGETDCDFREFSYDIIKSALATRLVSVDDHSSFAALQPGSTFNRLINHTSNNPNPNKATPYVDTMNRVGVTTANAKALGLLQTTSSLDASIRFSSDFPFYFDHNGGIQGNQIDFVGAAAHEIGHVLGFVSGVDDIDVGGDASAGGTFSSDMIDLFRYSKESLAAGPGYTDYTADQRDKYFSVNGGSSMEAAFATGLIFGDGTQASHWKDNEGIGIMDPTASSGELLKMTEMDLKPFDVMGYTLVPEPGAVTLMVGGGLILLFIRARRSQTSH